MAALLLSLAAVPVRAQAQPAEEPDENTKAMYYSLYYEEFKNENYEAALPNLRWILEHAPGYPRNDDRNFERAVEAYTALAEQTGEEAYLDSALAIFDTAVPTIEDIGGEVDEYDWTLEKGRFIQSHPAAFADLQDQVAGLYEQAYQLDPTRMQPYYIQVIISDYAQQDKQKAVDFAEELEERFSDNPEITSIVTQTRNALFRTPEERMAFLEDQLAKNPDDLEIVNELFSIYRNLGEREKMYELGERLLEMEPSPTVYRQIAQMRLGDAEYEEAFELYQRAIEMPGAEPKAEDYYNMGIAQQNMGSLARARTYFRQAAEVNPNFGRAYIAIGDLYAQAVSECGGAAMSRDDKAVYWLAVDYYQRAKQADPSVASAADQKINTYRRYFPTEEEKFFNNWAAGQRVSINSGCYSWIGETTTVR